MEQGECNWVRPLFIYDIGRICLDKLSSTAKLSQVKFLMSLFTTGAGKNNLLQDDTTM